MRCAIFCWTGVQVWSVWEVHFARPTHSRAYCSPMPPAKKAGRDKDLFRGDLVFAVCELNEGSIWWPGQVQNEGSSYVKEDATVLFFGDGSQGELTLKKPSASHGQSNSCRRGWQTRNISAVASAACRWYWIATQGQGLCSCFQLFTTLSRPYGHHAAFQTIAHCT